MCAKAEGETEKPIGAKCLKAGEKAEKCVENSQKLRDKRGTVAKNMCKRDNM